MTTARRPADPTDAELERNLLEGRRLEDAPEHVIQRALAAWKPRRQAAAAPGLLERVLAVLTFDSGAASPLAFGRRSGGDSTRQLLFSADGHDIDLRIGPAEGAATDHWLLTGQVLGPDGKGMVTLTDALGQPAGETPLSELGEFRLAGIAPGTYTVTLRLGQREIVLPSVLVPQAI